MSEKIEAKRFKKALDIITIHNHDKSKLIPILQHIQHEYGYLPEDIMIYVASKLGITPANLFSVATFYSHFALKPKGKYVIKLCDGTACHVKGSNPLLLELRKILKLSEDKNTTDDMLFTVETVSCLGACGLAPVIVINEEVHGEVTKEKLNLIIKEILTKERK